jgi:hypothetical protein
VDSGPEEGGQILTVFGGPLGSGTDITTVLLGDNAATTVLSQSATHVVVMTAPAPSLGRVSVSTHSTSVGIATIPNAYTYNPGLLISVLNPHRL